MAMNSASTLMSLSWDQYKLFSGFDNVSQGPDSLSASVSPLLTGATPCNIVFAEQRTLTSASVQVYNLFSGGLLDFFSTTVAMTRIHAVAIKCTDGDVTLAPNGTNGLVWFFAGTTPSVNVLSGGSFLYSQYAPFTVASGTSSMKITAGSASATYKIAFLGGQ